jgi:hypothetical protein
MTLTPSPIYAAIIGCCLGALAFWVAIKSDGRPEKKPKQR